MARTKTKPGPKPKYGEREEIHVLVPKADLEYIRSVTGNVNEWVTKAIQEKRQRESEAPPSNLGEAGRKFFTQEGKPIGENERRRLQKAAEEALMNDKSVAANNRLANEIAAIEGVDRREFVRRFVAAGGTRKDAFSSLAMLEHSYGATMGSDAMRLAAEKALAEGERDEHPSPEQSGSTY